MGDKKKAAALFTMIVLSFAVLGILFLADKKRTQSAGSKEVISSEAEAESTEKHSETGQSEQNTKEPSKEETATDIVKNTTLCFSGDIMLSDYILNQYNNGGISGVLDGILLDEMQKADIMMANQEFPFSSRGEKAADKQYTFRVDPEKISIFKEMGIDIVTLANNHILDFGREALEDSCNTLDAAGIEYVGAGENADRARKLAVIEKNGMRIGFLGASRVIPVTSWVAGESVSGVWSTYEPYKQEVFEEIRKAKETCDLVVIYVHWGIEREEWPLDYQKKLGRDYIDAGADLVIGSHPHVLQGIEYYNGKPIVYSLGNFMFGSSIPRTALLKAEVAPGGEVSLSLVPAVSLNGYASALEDSKKEEFYSYLESISFGITIDRESGRVLPKR